MSESEKEPERIIGPNAEFVAQVVAEMLDIVRGYLGPDYSLCFYARNLTMPDDKNADMMLTNDPDDQKLVSGIKRILTRPAVMVNENGVLPSQGVH